MSSPISVQRTGCSSIDAQWSMRLSKLICPKFLSLLVLFAASSGLWAQSAPEALGFKVGETDLYPSVRIDYLQNNNAFLTESNSTSAGEITISPELNWVADRRLLRLQATYNGNYNSASEDALNYADHTLSFEADAELSSRKNVDAKLSLNFGHEDLGTNLTRADADENSEQVKYTDIVASTSFRYGANKARGNVTIGLGLQDHGYSSRRDVTAGRSFSFVEPFAAFSYRLSGDTRAVAEVRFATVDFDDNDRDRTDLSLLAGMNFAATGKTGGRFRAGVVQSQPDSSSVNSSTEVVLEASLFWEPTNYSRFTLVGTRLLENEGGSLVNADAVAAIRNSVELKWVHRWSSRVSHTAFLLGQAIEQDCPNLDRNLVTGNIEVNFQIRRWLSFGLSGNGSNAVHSDCPDKPTQELDFDRTRFGAHIRATL